MRKLSAELLARFPLPQWWDSIIHFWEFVTAISLLFSSLTKHHRETTRPRFSPAAKVAIYVLCNKAIINSQELERNFSEVWTLVSPVLLAQSQETDDKLGVLQLALIDFFALCIAKSVSHLSSIQAPDVVALLSRPVTGDVINFSSLIHFFVHLLDLGRLTKAQDLAAALQSESETQRRVLVLNSLIAASKILVDQKVMTADGVDGVTVYCTIMLPLLLRILENPANSAMSGPYLQLVFSLTFHLKQGAVAFASRLRECCLQGLQNSRDHLARSSGLKLLGSTFVTAPEIWEGDAAAFMQATRLLALLAATDEDPGCKSLASQLLDAVSIEKS